MASVSGKARKNGAKAPMHHYKFSDETAFITKKGWNVTLRRPEDEKEAEKGKWLLVSIPKDIALPSEISKYGGVLVSSDAEEVMAVDAASAIAHDKERLLMQTISDLRDQNAALLQEQTNNAAMLSQLAEQLAVLQTKVDKKEPKDGEVV